MSPRASAVSEPGSPQSPPPRPSDERAVRVVSFNTRNGFAIDGRNLWWCRRGRVVATLVRLDADLVGLQEVYRFQARWLRRRLVDHEAYGVGRTDGGRRGEQALVLYRRDRFDLVEARTRWYGADPDRPGTKLPGAMFPRTAAMVRLRDRVTGQPLVFVDTHLDAHVAGNRRASAAQLGGWLSREASPVVVAGDLNEEPDGPAVTELMEAAGLVQAVPAGAGGSNHDFTGRTDGRRIDHVLVSSSWKVLGGWVDHRRVDGNLASDHWPVGADIVLDDAGRAASAAEGGP